MRRTNLALAFLAPALAACGSGRGGSSAAPEPAAIVRNHAVAADAVFGSGALRVVALSESGTRVDFTGDGDRSDVVVQMLDLERGTLENTALALTPGAFGGGLADPRVGGSDSMALFFVSEDATGRDLDADGDLGSQDVWVFDRRARALDPLPVGGEVFALDGHVAAFQTFDFAAPRVQVFDVRDGSLVSLPFASTLAVALADPLVALVQWEGHEVDLNADGDATDEVLHVYDSATRATVQTGWSVTTRVRFAGGHVGAFVSEREQGETDLDGDGLALSEVFVVLDAASGAASVPGLRITNFADTVGSDPERFLVLVRERPGEDFNADGDSRDSVLALHDPRTGATRHTGLATRRPALSAGRWVVVHVAEGMQGETDLDGDGDAFGDVLHVYDTATGRIDNLRFQAETLAAADGFVLLEHFELVSNVDSNGDGDVEDFVLFGWDARSRRLHDAGRSVFGVQGAAGEHALVSILEVDEGEDLDGDGDTDDAVLALYHGRTGTLEVLGLAAEGGAWLGEHGAALLVPEWAQGRDLNGDGDLDDAVLHTLRFGS